MFLTQGLNIDPYRKNPIINYYGGKYAGLGAKIYFTAGECYREHGNKECAPCRQPVISGAVCKDWDKWGLNFLNIIIIYINNLTDHAREFPRGMQ